MEVKFSIEGVNYYQLAALVEEDIINRDFSTPSGEPVALSTRRSFTPAGLAHRLEIGVGGDLVHPITLDCHAFTERLLVTATCPQEEHQPVFEKLLKELCHYLNIPEPESLTPRQSEEEEGKEGEGSESTQTRTWNLGTGQAVAEAKYLITARGYTKTAACDFVGIDRRTYNRWCDHEAVDSLLEDIQEHPPDL